VFSCLSDFCGLRPAGNYAPTPAHHFIKLLHEKGLLLRCFTQNIDSLEHQVTRAVGIVSCIHGLHMQDMRHMCMDWHFVKTW
jgi:NAD-dependent SIR2 family protein deacetylase